MSKSPNCKLDFSKQKRPSPTCGLRRTGASRAGCRWSKAGANALLGVKCRIDNNLWTDFLGWRACRGEAT